MQTSWDGWEEQYKKCPIIKVDGVIIRNVVTADDVEGVVKFVKATKIKTIRGTVEIIGDRK